MRYLSSTAALIALLGGNAYAQGSCSTVYGNGTWSAQGSQLIGPNGQPFHAQGVNVLWEDIASMWTPGASSQPLLQQLPGTNYVRLLFSDSNFPSVAQLAPYITDMNAHGIVVALEDWTYPQTNLSAASAWYGQMAAAFNGDSGVVYETPNEPAASSTDQGVQTVFNAVRGTGNNGLIVVNPSGGSSPYGMNPALYQSLQGPWMWSDHQYNWTSGYSADLGANAAALQANISALQAISNKPVIIDEFGNSTDGANTDPGWQASVQAVLNSGYGWSAFGWNGPEFTGWGHPGGDQMLSGGALNAFGQMIAGGMASGPNCGTSVTPEQALAQAMGQVPQSTSEIPIALSSGVGSCISTTTATALQISDATVQAAEKALAAAITQEPAAVQQEAAAALNDNVAAAALSGLSICPTKITPGSGSITNAAGQTFTIDPTTANQVMINGKPATPNGEGTDTSAVTTVDGKVYGQDQNTKQWFELIQDPERPYWLPLSELPAPGQSPVPTTRWPS